MKRYIFIVIASAAFIGCSPKYYSPNTQNVPLFSESGEWNLSAAGNDNQFEFQAAYAVTDGFAVQANAGLFVPKDLDNGDGGSGRFIEMGAGYFKPVTDKLIFELYGLAGFGGVENELRSRATTDPVTNGTLSASVFRYGFQPNFGFKSKYFSAAVSSRIVNVLYSNVDGSLMYDGENQQAYLNDNNSNFLIEPALTLRGGFDVAKLQLQIGRSFNLSNSDFRQDKAFATVGLNFRFR